VRAVLLVLLILGAGCAAPRDAPVDPPRLDVFDYAYAAGALTYDGTPFGWALRLSNPDAAAVTVLVDPYGIDTIRFGPATESRWISVQRSGDDPPVPAPLHGPVSVVRLAPGESTLLLFRLDGQAPVGQLGVDLRFVAGPEAVQGDGVDVLHTQRVPKHVVAGGAPGATVQVGDQVQVTTVGLWVNGTSFYSNNQALHDMPAFPRGYAAADFDGAPLGIYVYDADRAEQPPASRDTCRFTTIPGFNAMLQEQALGSTFVRWLAPEQAYTRTGSENHLLYGDALVFLTTVVAHDGPTGDLGTAPEPQGDCFDAQNTLDYLAIPP